MNILLISDAYPPEVRSASRLMYEFALSMAENGHRATVLTTYPKYNIAEGSRTAFDTVELEGGIKVVRIETLDIHLVGMIRRGIGVLSLPLYFFAAGKTFINDSIDIVLVYSPPLPLAIAGYLLSKRFDAKFVLNVQDLFPQNAIDLGIVRNPVMIRFFELMEKVAYSKADFISVHSFGNLKIITNDKHLSSKKVGIFHNWVNIQPTLETHEKQTDFRTEFGLEGEFIILFGGVMGPAQGLDVVLSAAEELKDSNACFLLIGDGTEKKHLQKMAAEKRLANIIFKPFVELDVYDSLMQCADVGLVTLHKDMRTPVVPGKLVSFLSKKIAVLTCLNPESDGRQIIQEGQCGFNSEAGDGTALAANVKTLMNNPDLVKKMGVSGFDYVKNTMNRDLVITQYEALFERLLSSN